MRDTRTAALHEHEYWRKLPHRHQAFGKLWLAEDIQGASVKSHYKASMQFSEPGSHAV
jgi:hypothetical protein